MSSRPPVARCERIGLLYSPPILVVEYLSADDPPKLRIRQIPITSAVATNNDVRTCVGDLIDRHNDVMRLIPFSQLHSLIQQLREHNEEENRQASHDAPLSPHEKTPQKNGSYLAAHLQQKKQERTDPFDVSIALSDIEDVMDSGIEDF
ncbi:hypothetical protein J8273_1757 [Carpediemonas membranifera]|uniref:Centrosomal protein of 19 kDa n=1 Tax=Carpediemonas membranifera TaxID=201153 RepID=A0A8J6B915_9EUKA|nr:hypothetical protein J8273_1757 [Carpediemonas membranifera]|eukprot:KAG9396739.1 hypothetical protein J8273_1757 [Carpediemonas membranifera]